jgi:hypothetical protein
MPFNAAQFTAFWTDNAQMALLHCTGGQMAAEGLTIPANFVDFAKKEEFEALLKRLYKPAKTTHGVGAAMVLREVQAYEVPARSVVRLHGVPVIVRYYNSVGRALEAGDLFLGRLEELHRAVEGIGGEEECRCWYSPEADEG